MLNEVPLEHLTKERLYWNFPAVGLNVLHCITMPQILRTASSFSAKIEAVSVRLLHEVPKYETVLLKIHFFKHRL
jgi:hypothetical protein